MSSTPVVVRRPFIADFRTADAFTGGDDQVPVAINDRFFDQLQMLPILGDHSRRIDGDRLVDDIRLHSDHRRDMFVFTRKPPHLGN